MPIHISQKEFDYFNEISNELTTDHTDQVFYYHKISKDKSVIHSLYNEVTEIVYELPIRIKGLINYNPQEIRFEQGQMKEEQFLDVYLTKKTLTDNTLYETASRDMIGNYISFGTKLYEILKVTTPQLVYGQHEWEYGITLNCKFAQYIYDTVIYNNIREVMVPLYSPTGLSISSIHTDSVLLSWDHAAIEPNGYLILQSLSSIDNHPVDNTKYTVGDYIGDAKVIYQDNVNSFRVFNLSASSTYYFNIYSYNNEVTNIMYLSSSALTGSTTTLTG